MNRIRNLLAALFLAVGVISPAAAFDITLNVDALANGTNFKGSALVNTALGNSSVTQAFDGTGTLPSFVVRTTGTNSGACSEVSGFNGVPARSKCIEFEYPQGGVGNIPTGAPGNAVGAWGTQRIEFGTAYTNIIDLEWDQELETGFDLHGINKMIMSIGVMDPADTASNRYTTIRTNAQCNSSYNATTCSGIDRWVHYLQRDSTGGHSGCTSTFTNIAVRTGVWYHFHQREDLTDPAHPVLSLWRQQITGSPTDGSPILELNCTWVPTAPLQNHSIHLMFNSWAGGNGTTDRATVNEYILTANIRTYNTTGAVVGDTTPPSVPTSVQATTYHLPPDFADCEVQITGNPSTDDTSVAGYHIKRGGSALATINGALSYIDTVTCGLTYGYTANAFDAAGNVSADSSPAASITMTDTTAPAVPTGLLGTVNSSTAITVAWGASHNGFGNPTTYHLRRDGSIVKTTTSLSAQDAGLAPSSTHTYTVDAADANGNTSAQSASIQATTTSGPDVTPPTTPGAPGLLAVGPTQANFSWPPSTDDKALAGYQVFRDGVLIATVVDPSYSDPNLLPSSSYTFTVKAIDAAANLSAASSALVVNTMANTGFTVLIPQAMILHFSTGP